jgi:hypothetical protein
MLNEAETFIGSACAPAEAPNTSSGAVSLFYRLFSANAEFQGELDKVGQGAVGASALARYKPCQRRDSMICAEPLGLVTVTDCWSPRRTIMTLPVSFPDVTVPW